MGQVRFILVVFMRVYIPPLLCKLIYGGSDWENLQDLLISLRVSGSSLKLAMTVGARFGQAALKADLQNKVRSKIFAQKRVISSSFGLRKYKMLLSLLLSMLSPRSRYGETKMPRLSSNTSQRQSLSPVVHFPHLFYCQHSEVIFFKVLLLFLLS